MRFFKWLLLLGILPSMAACSTSTFEWKEEVQLSDGRVIVVTQKRRYEHGYDGQGYSDITRESWLTFSLPETSGEIVWNETLVPMILNVADKRVYLIATYPSAGEWYDSNKPESFYVCFVLENFHWMKIPPTQIPTSIYDTNLLSDRRPKSDLKFITLTQKNSKEMNGNASIFKDYKRFDPNLKFRN